MFFLVDSSSFVVLKLRTARPYEMHPNVMKLYPPGQVKKVTAGKHRGRKKGK